MANGKERGRVRQRERNKRAREERDGGRERMKDRKPTKENEGERRQTGKLHGRAIERKIPDR